MERKPSTNEFGIWKIETKVLKVHINCEGCKRKVKKLLRSIEGVYTVDIDTEHHKVTVTGTADSETIIKKLGRAGKHAEIWSPNSFRDLNQEDLGLIKDGRARNSMQCQILGPKAPEGRPFRAPTLGSEVGEHWGYYGYLMNQNLGMEPNETVMRMCMDDDHVGGKYYERVAPSNSQIPRPPLGFQGDADGMMLSWIPSHTSIIRHDGERHGGTVSLQTSNSDDDDEEYWHA